MVLFHLNPSQFGFSMSFLIRTDALRVESWNSGLRSRWYNVFRAEKGTEIATRQKPGASIRIVCNYLLALVIPFRNFRAVFRQEPFSSSF